MAVECYTNERDESCCRIQIDVAGDATLGCGRAPLSRTMFLLRRCGKDAACWSWVDFRREWMLGCSSFNEIDGHSAPISIAFATYYLEFQFQFIRWDQWSHDWEIEASEFIRRAKDPFGWFCVRRNFGRDLNIFYVSSLSPVFFYNFFFFIFFFELSFVLLQVRGI